MGRLRIAIYHNLHSGGAKRVAAEHLRRLSQRHDVALFSLDIADAAFGVSNAALALPSTIEHFAPLAWLRRPLGRFNTLIGMLNVARLDQTSLAIARKIDRGNFDVVLAHPCQITQAPLVLKWLRTPSLYYCHELPRLLYEPPIARPYTVRSRAQRALDHLDPLPATCRAYYRAMDLRAARAAYQIAVNSRHTAANVQRVYGIAPTICYQGVDCVQFAPQTVRERFVLSVGALTPSKGFDFIIDALAMIDKNERPKLVIISNYQDRQELAYLQSHALQCGVDLVCRVAVPDSELQQLYARAGCVAYAPIREPFGLVALEAMASGAAVVGVSEGGVAETIIDGVTGVLAPRDPAAFGNAVVATLRDPMRAKRLGRTARNFVMAQWTWERHIAQLEGLLAHAAMPAATQAIMESLP